MKYESGKLLSYSTVGNLLHHSLTKASCGEKSTKRADRWGLELKIWLNQLKNLIALVPSHLASVALEKISCGDRKKRWKLDPCWCFLLLHALFYKTFQLCTCVYIHTYAICNMHIWNTESERARHKQIKNLVIFYIFHTHPTLLKKPSSIKMRLRIKTSLFCDDISSEIMTVTCLELEGLILDSLD